MRESLALRLEQLSYYEHRTLAGGGMEPAIYASRLVEIRGALYHVLSRLVDADLDFTNRSNFFAHHLVFSPEELAFLPMAPVILSSWDGWVSEWDGEPELLHNESWGNLHHLCKDLQLPALTWERLTGDGANALGLMETPPTSFLETDGLEDVMLLRMLWESLSLLGIRNGNQDSRNTAWRYTFTTSLQEQDQVSDFRWRFVHSNSPAKARLASSGQAVIGLKDLRPGPARADELAAARSGLKPPQILVEPEDLKLVQGEPAALRVDATGVPIPSKFQWYACTRKGETQIIPGQTSQELCLEDLGQGVSRYQVVVSNSLGESVASRIALVSVEAGKSVSSAVPKAPHRPPSPKASHRTESEKVSTQAPKTKGNTPFIQPNSDQQQWRWMFISIGLALMIFMTVLGGGYYHLRGNAISSNTNGIASEWPTHSAESPLSYSGSNDFRDDDQVIATTPVQVLRDTNQPTTKTGFDSGAPQRPVNQPSTPQ